MKGIKAGSISLGVFALCVALTVPYKSFAQSGDQKGSEPTKSQLVEPDKGQKAPSGKDVIGYLHTRDKVVTISAGSKGKVYTVKDKNGKTLAAGLSERDFEAKYPALHGQIKNGLAGNDASLQRRVMPVVDPAADRR